MAGTPHGTERNRHEEIQYGAKVDFHLSDGRPVYSGPLSALTETVTERYCATCDKWVECRGVLGPILFGFEHEHEHEHEE